MADTPDPKADPGPKQKADPNQKPKADPGPKPKGKQKATRSQIAWTLLLVVWVPMAALLIWGKGGFMDLSALRKEVRQLQEDVSKLEDENARIRSEIHRLQTDPAAYEALARERFFMKKPGERILYIPPKEGATPAPNLPPMPGVAATASPSTAGTPAPR